MAEIHVRKLLFLACQDLLFYFVYCSFSYIFGPPVFFSFVKDCGDFGISSGFVVCLGRKTSEEGCRTGKLSSAVIRRRRQRSLPDERTKKW